MAKLSYKDPRHSAHKLKWRTLIMKETHQLNCIMEENDVRHALHHARYIVSLLQQRMNEIYTSDTWEDVVKKDGST